MSKIDSPTALVWKHCPTKYSGTPLVVLLKIAGLSMAKNGYAHVRVPKLAKMCGVTARRAQQIVNALRKDRILKVRYRKSQSSIFTLDLELVKSLPLALPPSEEQTEQPTGEEQTPEAEPATPQLSDALFISGLLKKSFGNKGLSAPDDWQAAWPTEFQKLLDAGHTVDVIRSVARFALGVECHREELVKRGPAMLVEKFAVLLELTETFGSKEAA